MESEKIGIDNLIYKTEIGIQTEKTSVWIPRGESQWYELRDWD